MRDAVAENDSLIIPLEIWSLVFSSYLPLEDRKNVRLTCRRFYDACCIHRIQRKEEMVIYGAYNSCSSIQSLCGSERKIWNIKLCKVHPIDDSVLPFFEKHGANIHSLTLLDCTLNRGILIDILGPCKNLRTFAVRFTRDCRVYSNNAVFLEFEVLRGRGIICSKVTDLTLELSNSCSRAITSKDLRQISALFPNIEKFNTFPVFTTRYWEGIESSYYLE